VSHSEPGNLDQSSLAIRRLRILAIVLGGCLLLWLPVEDSRDHWALMFAAAICSLAAAHIFLRLKKHFGKRSYWLPLAGLLAGALVTPAAFLLMAIKTGLHAHQTPDFTGDQIQAVVVRTPIWVISGLLVGLGVELFGRANRPNPGANNQL
jgi:ABC-type enterochelin transport system permease subunit